MKSYFKFWYKGVKYASPSAKGFCVIFVVIPQHQKGCLVYIPHTRKIISSYNVVFNGSLSSALAYTSQAYPGAMAIRLDVLYTSYATSSMEQTGNIITFAQFEEGNLLYETQNLLSETHDHA